MKTAITVTALSAATLALMTGVRADGLRGQYVEARTASVFAGACHYNGEYVSDGREAVEAWHITQGTWHGVPLAGLSAVAAVRSDQNLAEAGSAHTTRLFVDAKATPAQQKALAEALTASCGTSFGQVVAVTPTPIQFKMTADGGYRVNAPAVTRLAVSPMPDRACCKQPNLVWYTPLAPIKDRRVGYTQTASLTERGGGDAWTRSGENSAFYGTFVF